MKLFIRWSNDQYVVDVTSYGQGARGIDLISARRFDSSFANDPLLTSSGLDTAVLGSTSRDRVSFPLYDGHGNTIATLARNGTGYSIANVKRYDVWGKVRSDSSVGSSGQILNPTQKYCGNLGHKYDATSGLTYMRARYYEAETGRFISEDPARDGLNWFVYCANDPISNADESGRDALDVTALTATLALLAGVILLGAAGGLSVEIANLTRVLEQWSAILQISGSAASGVHGIALEGNNIQKTIQKLNKIKSQQANMSRAGRGAIATAILGYSLVIFALCLDVDIAADGPGALETLFGG